MYLIDQILQEIYGCSFVFPLYIFKTCMLLDFMYGVVLVSTTALILVSYADGRINYSVSKSIFGDKHMILFLRYLKKYKNLHIVLNISAACNKCNVHQKYTKFSCRPSAEEGQLRRESGSRRPRVPGRRSGVSGRRSVGVGRQRRP